MDDRIHPNRYEAPVLACPDPIVEAVVAKQRGRSTFGVNKYGVTLFDSKQSRLEFLVHAQEEALDFANYLEVLIQRERGGESKAAVEGAG